MIPENKYHTLQELIRTSTPEEIIWINGYLNGIVSGVVNGKNGHTNGQEHPKNGSATVVSTKKMTIAYGTETGNSKKLALQFSASAKKEKITVKCVALEQYRHEDISKEDHLFIIISTQGEGEPPETAKKFIHFIEQYSGRLEGVKYSVLALGDTSYPLFCKTGEDVDNRLKELGAECVHPIVKCDVDYDEPAAAWYQSISSLFSHAVAEPEIAPQGAPAPKKSARKNIQGTIVKSINLNDRGSQKETYHMEIVTDEELDYEPGDSIAIIPANNVQVVNKLISIAGVEPETETVAENSAVLSKNFYLII
jgi:sulfite reductase (NADPH) flavoprotein alpha-component